MPETAGAGARRTPLGRLLAEGVAYAEAGPEQLRAAAPPLWPGEEVGLAERAEAGRTSAYRWGRTLARLAMADLGRAPAPVLRGRGREPRWPEGLVGTITHCRAYCAAAVARSRDFAAIGIDAEVVRPVGAGVLHRIATDAELEQLAGRPPAAERRAVALFSAKEAVYKAWFPLTGRWLGFKDAVVEIEDPLAGGEGPATFVARLLVPGPMVGGRRLSSFEGSLVFDGELVVSAVTVPA